jgi:hypothetical protein
MSGKWQLFLHRKYADPLPLLCFNLWLARQDEGCFREIHLASEGLHFRIIQAARVSENGERISRQWPPGKNIKLYEFVTVRHYWTFCLLPVTLNPLSRRPGHLVASAEMEASRKGGSTIPLCLQSQSM